MNAILRRIEYPKGGGSRKEIETFSINEFIIDSIRMTVTYQRGNDPVSHIRGNFINFNAQSGVPIITVGNEEV